MGEPFGNIAWDDFRLIKAIADARGLQGAAAQLGLNHSTMFRRLGQIEQALGATLFERHRSGYVLTPVGEEMAELAARVDDDITGFTRKVAGRTISPAGELRVTTNDSLLIHLLTPLFARFQRQCPDVRLDVVLSNEPLNLSKRDADVAIRATDRPPETLVGRRVARIAWALYGRAADFPRPELPVFDDLTDRPWVSLGDNLAALKAVRFVRQHVAPERIVYRVNTVLGLAEAIESGVGIGHLPCFIGDVRPTLVRLGPPVPDFAADLWLLTHPDLRQSARVRVFLDYLAGEIGKSRPLFEGNLATPGAPGATAESSAA
jgi:DNA-binding transcriptional LysR family regulator